MATRMPALIPVACLLFAIGAFAQTKDADLLTYGIVGSESGAYSETMSHIPVQKLLLDLAALPRSPEYVDSALAGSGASRADLERLGLVQARGGSYLVHFTLFTKSDVVRIRAIAEDESKSLAGAFLARRADIASALKSYDVKTVDREAVAYIVLGCFSLDWDGLDVTAEENYRTTSKPQPNGDNYIPWAEEKGELTLERIYWGSHNNFLQPDGNFTSFGDHFSLPRNGLPDLFWRLPGRAVQTGLPDSLQQSVRGVLSFSLQQTERRLGRLMLDLRTGEKTAAELAKIEDAQLDDAKSLLGFLVALGYVSESGGRYAAMVPVLTEIDRHMIAELRRMGREIMRQWLEANYNRIREQLHDLTPTRDGVSYADGFTQIWHYLFGITNRRLVEAKLFADPYASSRVGKGFIPCVWEFSLLRP
jgi:hypothetical protein